MPTKIWVINLKKKWIYIKYNNGQITTYVFELDRNAKQLRCNKNIKSSDE